jgi:L-amino acid N-acyltransferase YncA
VTAYVAPDYARRGIGSSLYTVLVAALRARSIHAAIGGIALPNDASIALHEKFGFRKVAHFEQVGFKFKRWIDVGYWQLIL